MTNKDVIDTVNNFPSWGGNAFTLAIEVVTRQREDATLLAEAMGQQAVADAIRAAE